MHNTSVIVVQSAGTSVPPWGWDLLLTGDTEAGSYACPRPSASLHGVPASPEQAEEAQVQGLLSSCFPDPLRVLYHLTESSGRGN